MLYPNKHSWLFYENISTNHSNLIYFFQLLFCQKKTLGISDKCFIFLRLAYRYSFNTKLFVRTLFNKVEEVIFSSCVNSNTGINGKGR